jgi:hypothetical protein
MKKNIKKRNLVFKTLFVTIVLLMSTSIVFGAAEGHNEYNQIVKIYVFPTPKIEQVKVGNQMYDRIIMEDSPPSGNPGEFNLPAHGAYLLLNPGAEISNIEVTPGEMIDLGSGFNIESVADPVAFSNNEIIYPSELKESDTISYNTFPDSLYENIGTYTFRGYEILVLQLHPVQYVTNSGSVHYFKDITVTVTTADKNLRNQLFRNMEKDEIEIAKRVDNPQNICSYTKQSTHPFASEYDLLILTTDELKGSFKPLKDAHDSNGMATEIKTLKDISMLPDLVKPKDIRDFIREEYRKNGIEFVLIGGDDDVVPVQKLWVEPWSGGDSTNMPSDLYYACLDGTYNFDNDDKWGEPSDGEGESDVDLVAEVYVGRACVGNPAEVNYFVEKTITYMNTGGYSNGKTLMVGEYLWSGPDTWGGDYMDELINGSSSNGYTTVGMPSSQYSINKLYDKEWSGYDWPKSEIISRINNDARIINHLGHSSYGYNMKMVNSDVSSLKNNELCFVYSQGCNAGGFDFNKSDCIAEYFTVKTYNAAFAVIMNARYGWGVKGSTNGASQRFHRQFWDAIFGENIAEIGKANQDSKEDLISSLHYSCIRWCYYQLNLFGDPTLTFYQSNNKAPKKPMKPTGEKSGTIDDEYSFSSFTTDSDGDSIYYKWDFGDGTFSDWLGPYKSGDVVSTTHQWNRWGRYEVKVKARDEHRAESDWSDPLPVSMPVIQKFPLLQLLFNFLEKCFPKIFTYLNEIIA